MHLLIMDHELGPREARTLRSLIREGDKLHWFHNLQEGTLPPAVNYVLISRRLWNHLLSDGETLMADPNSKLSAMADLLASDLLTVLILLESDDGVTVTALLTELAAHKLVLTEETTAA